MIPPIENTTAVLLSVAGIWTLAVVTPGPNFFLAIRTALGQSRPAALWNVLGIACGTVIWGLGYTGWRGITFDPLILVIPMIITARAVSHTVQMAERFFEDYETLLPRYGDPDVAKREVATVAMGELIVPGTLGIITDVCGLLVILVTSIPQMRDLGEFGAFWVASIIVTVEILHPVLICYMPAPTEHELLSNVN